MRFNWSAFASFIAKISQLALEWYREIEGRNPGTEDERRIRKAVSVVLDPDTPETDVSEVEVK